MVDVVLCGELFVPFGVVGVGGDVIFEECVVFEKNAGSFGVRTEGGGKGGISVFDCVKCFFGDHFVPCGVHILILIEIYLYCGG